MALAVLDEIADSGVFDPRHSDIDGEFSINPVAVQRQIRALDLELLTFTTSKAAPITV